MRCNPLINKKLNVNPIVQTQKVSKQWYKTGMASLELLIQLRDAIPAKLLTMNLNPVFPKNLN